MKIAIAQINPIIADINGNREKIISFIDRAREGKADLVVFPEMAVIGYPPMDLLENKKLIRDNLASLEEIAMHSKGIDVICGYVDFDRDNPPMLFNAAALMQGGSITLRQHKTLLPTYDVFDELRYFSRAREHHVVELGGHQAGITICEDIWNALSLADSKFTENRKYEVDPIEIISQKNVDIIINISASPFTRGKNRAKQRMLSEIARSHSAAVIYVNQVGGNDSLIFDGNSVVFNKKGDIIALARAFEEDLIIIDADSPGALTVEDNEIEDIRKAVVLGIRDYVLKCGFSKVTIGLSGGIDSALTAVLAVQALGPENVTGVTMPSVYSSTGSVEDSRRLAENLGIRFETVPIRELFDRYRLDLKPLFGDRPEDVTEENIQARIRGNILMALSNKEGSLVLSTGNKSELAMGYCTLYGDMSGGLAAISDLPKTLVYQLSRHINSSAPLIPEEILAKAPSAELRPNQKDQDTLPPYEILDRVLELYIEDRKSAEEIIAEGIEPDLVKRVLHTVNVNEYKRLQAAPGIRVTAKAFGVGRRIPIAQRFRP